LLTENSDRASLVDYQKGIMYYDSLEKKSIGVELYLISTQFQKQKFKLR
jgi:hypothetical protein